MNAISRVIRNIWHAIRRAAVEPVKHVGDALTKGRPMTKQEKETLRNILMLIGAIVFIRMPYMNWVGSILAFVSVMNFFILLVNIVDELAKGEPDGGANTADIGPQPAAA